MTYSNAATSGVITWDCKYNEEVLLIPCGLFLAGDNSMQAEECSHAGLNCNYFCRTCDIGGTKEFKASGDGYSSLFTVSMYLNQTLTPDDVLVVRKSANTRKHCNKHPTAV